MAAMESLPKSKVLFWKRWSHVSAGERDLACYLGQVRHRNHLVHQFYVEHLKFHNVYVIHPLSFLLLSSPGVMTLTVFLWLCPCDRPPKLLVLSLLKIRLSSP